MKKTIELFGNTVKITFEDNFEYIFWGNEVTEEKKIDKLPKTDIAYKVLGDFKDATSVLAMSDKDYKRCVIYERKSPRCSNWAVHYCNMN